MPPGFWPYAMRAYCLSENIAADSKGTSNWERRHRGAKFKGKRIPFGALVYFKPSKDKELPKACPRGIPGVFMGWDLQPGGHFKDVYRVAPITDFEDIDLTLWGSASDVTPDHTSELFFDGDWKFPLKQKYDAVNTVVSGTYEDKRNTEDCPPMPKEFNVECDTPQEHKPAHPPLDTDGPVDDEGAGDAGDENHDAASGGSSSSSSGVSPNQLWRGGAQVHP